MDAKTRQKTLRLLSNGMYVMTSRSGNHYGGATVTWVSQASFKPPLLMAALRRESNVFQCLAESRIAALHILGGEQQDVARKFFSSTQVVDGVMNGEPFAEGKTSVPILQNALAHVECQIHQIVDNGGDHAVVIMEVVEAECREQVRPLTIAESPWEYGG
jgi:flavin reductase (DIM6/NTAB) family NADH-FMN oxidoreductase RutF